MLHISLGYLNIYRQLFSGSMTIASKVLLICVILLCLMKMFFFMRIIESFSYIVTMITMVINDLQVFMLFFAILIIMFSMIFDVISENKAPEYDHVGYYLGNVFTTLRLSLGDFDFTPIGDDSTLTTD